MDQYQPQAGDTTIDEVINLLREALEWLETRSKEPDVANFMERADAFCDEHSK